MKDVIASEALKLRTLRLPWALPVLGVALSGVIGAAMVRIDVDRGESVSFADLAAAPAQSVWFLGVIVSVLATAGEFQHRTVRTTLLQTPRRAQVLTTKAVVLGVYGALLAFLGAAAAVVSGAIAMSSEGLSLELSLDVGWTVAGSMVIGALWAVFAVGLGLLVRNSTVALVTVLLWTFVIENLVPMVTNSPELRQWMPSNAAVSVLHGGASPAYAAPEVGALAFVCYTAAVLLAGSASFLRRDPT